MLQRARRGGGSHRDVEIGVGELPRIEGLDQVFSDEMAAAREIDDGGMLLE
jgi:hypothetical protein